MKGKKVGYVRVSTVEGDAARQLDGCQLDRVFVDHVSGRVTSRPELTELLRFVREGDLVLVHSLDRLARNLEDLRRVIADLTGRGVTVTFVDEQLTFTGEDSPSAHLLLSVVGAFAKFELALVQERQREGIEIARARGAYRGRRPSLTPAQARQLHVRSAAGESKTALAAAFGISRETVYQYLRSAPHHLAAARAMNCETTGTSNGRS